VAVLMASETVSMSSEVVAVAPAAEASEAAMRGRLDRRVGAEAVWGFSKGKTDSLGLNVKLGGACDSHRFGPVKVTIG
jgi:hypothetical protein